MCIEYTSKNTDSILIHQVHHILSINFPYIHFLVINYLVY